LLPELRAKCQTLLPRGAVAYYWPQTRTLFCTNCGEPEYRNYLSSAADEEVYARNGNPY